MCKKVLLTEILCSKYGVSPAAIGSLLSKTEIRTFEPHQIVFNTNRHRQYYYIICDGTWRGYRISDGQEITLWFEHNGDIGYSEATEDYVIESMSKSSAYIILKSELDELCEQSLEMSNLIRKIWEQYYLEITHWLVILSERSAKTRYLVMLKNYPDIFQWVSQKHIASCLGMAPQSLSRIRRQLIK